MTKRPRPASPLEEELVAADDTIIARAFKWSLAVFALVGVVAAVIVWVVTRPEPAPPPTQVEVTAPLAIEANPEAPRARFVDVTTGAGIDFVHENGAYGDKLLPETMGGGCAFLDYNGDGAPDILFVNSARWPGAPAVDGPAPTMALYRNDGTGRYENVTQGSGLDVTFYGMGAAVGDYDGDGDPDVFISAVGKNRLFRNDGGTFADVAAAAGVAGADDQWSTSAGFFDYDNDGDLDLFVCNYIRWSREIDFAVDYQLVGLGRAYGPPTNFSGTQPYFYRNNGDGSFDEVAESAGMHVVNEATGDPVAKSLAVTFMDVGADGLMDVFVANDTVRNFLFRNRGDGSFEEVGVASGVAYDSMGNSTGAMGVDAADYRNENTVGIGIGNFANEMTSLYLAELGPWQFADAAIIEGIGAPSRLALSFGLFFFDFDLDGRLDMFQTNGHLEEEINQVQSSQHYHQPSQLFWNCGPAARACFSEVPGESVGDLATPVVGRGAAFADIDADGDLDVLITQSGDRPLLLRNDQELGHNWLRLHLVGTASNREAIGAQVVATVNGRVLRRQVMPTRSYLSQVELPVTLGLGDATDIERLQIVWPGGGEQLVEPASINTLLVIEEKAG